MVESASQTLSVRSSLPVTRAKPTGLRSALGAGAGRVAGGVGQPKLRESAQAKRAGVAMSAGGPRVVRIVAGRGAGVVDAEAQAKLDDLALAEVQERRANANRAIPLDATA